MGSLQSKTDNQSEREELLVNGFVRALDPNTSPPEDIYRLCYRFYRCPIWIFGNSNFAFHIIDVARPHSPTLYQDIIQSESYNSKNRYFDVSCYIPHIAVPKLHTLFPADCSISSNASYQGIITRKVINVPLGDDPSSPMGSVSIMILYVFESNNNGNPQSATDLKLEQKPSDSGKSWFEHLIYCAPRRSIIGINGLEVHELLIENLDGKFQFSEIGNYDSWDYEYYTSRLWTVKYIEEKNLLIAFHVYEMGHLYFECFQFDWDEGRWIDFERFKVDSKMKQKSMSKWGLCYDATKDIMYFVSTSGHIVIFDFNQMEHNLVYEPMENVPDFTFTGAPAVWINECLEGFLFCAGVPVEGHRMCFMQMNLTMKSKFKQWAPCQNDFVAISRRLGALSVRRFFI